EDRATDVFEINIDAIADRCAQISGKSRGLVVYAGIETELIDHNFAFGRASGDADGAAAPSLGKLPGHAADRACRGRDHDRFAILRPTDLDQADPRGDAGRTETAKIGGERRRGRVDFLQFGCGSNTVILPAEPADDPIPRMKFRMAALDHLGDGPPHHDVTELHHRRIGVFLLHAHADVRIDGDKVVPNEDLLRADFADRRLHQLEAFEAWFAYRPLGVDD